MTKSEKENSDFVGMINSDMLTACTFCIHAFSGTMNIWEEWRKVPEQKLMLSK